MASIHAISQATNRRIRNGSRMEFEHKVGALDDEDLVATEKEEKNWKGIVISLLVIGSILGAIIVSIILCTPANDVDNNRMKLEFEQIVSEAFRVKVFNGSWLSDYEIVYVDQDGSIVIFDADTNKSSSILVRTHDKTLHTMTGFKLSADRQSVLFESDRREEFGYPISARYAIFNISSQNVEFLDDLIRANIASIVQPRVQYATWGSKPNSLLFIESHDIYYIPDFTSSETGKYVRLTTRPASSPPSSSWSSQQSAANDEPNSKQGKPTSPLISNGIPDILYRMNIFKESHSASVWPSPDGNHLAYLSYDDSEVEPTPIEVYGSGLSSGAEPDAGSVYPHIYLDRYPRAGAPNPTVTLHVIELGNDSPTETDVKLSPPKELTRQSSSDRRLSPYITFVGWLPSPGDQLLVLWANRAQNSSWLTICDKHSDWQCEAVASFTPKLPPLSSQAKPTILATTGQDGSRMIFMVLSRPDSVIGEHLHVALLKGKQSARYLTHGQFDVDRLVGYDAKTDSLYFEAGVSEAAERHIYRLVSVNEPSLRQTKCITCQLNEEQACSYNYGHLSPGARYLVHECLGPAIPTTRMRLLKELGHDNQTASELFMSSRYVLNRNELLENSLRTKQMPIEKLINIRTNAGGPFANGPAFSQANCDIRIKFYLPVEIEEERDKKFPLLIESSELERRQVWKRFELDWGKYLASRKQVIYAKLDCIRSSSGVPSASSGWASESGHRVRSGAVNSANAFEAQPEPLLSARDQAEVIKFLAENVDLFPYIDRRRIAIWGPKPSSAYLALASTALDESRLIQCTIAVSPITNWRYASSYLAERQLGLPWLDANALKYERANLLRRANELANRRLLLVHGTADEQVHIQHSMQLIKALAEHTSSSNSGPASQSALAAAHQMQIYPDVGHSLEQVRRHFYLTLDSFVERCFYQKPIAIKATEWKGKVRPKLY